MVAWAPVIPVAVMFEILGGVWSVESTVMMTAWAPAPGTDSRPTAWALTGTTDGPPPSTAAYHVLLGSKSVKSKFVLVAAAVQAKLKPALKSRLRATWSMSAGFNATTLLTTLI